MGWTKKNANERRAKLVQLEFGLMQQRGNLEFIRIATGCSRMYGEGLIEYARLLGEWEKLLTDTEAYGGKNK